MKLDPQKQDEIKRRLGKKAAELIEPGMLVGLGTGSTASYFIESLIERCKAGLKISAVSSSIRSLEQAQRGGIPIMDVNQIISIDLTVDGADEIDPQNRMIKGGGGAQTREKIIASCSKKILIIVDESKVVNQLGKFGVPLEILPFGYSSTIFKIEELGYKGQMRTLNRGSPFITDNGNYIYDLHTPDQYPHPEEDHQRIITIPGVVETGFFFNLPTEVLIGYRDGSVKFR